MKAPKKIKQWINKMRSKHGKNNGVLKSWWFDFPEYEIEADTNKRLYLRHREKVKGSDDG